MHLIIFIIFFSSLKNWMRLSKQLSTWGCLSPNLMVLAWSSNLYKEKINSHKCPLITHICCVIHVCARACVCACITCTHTHTQRKHFLKKIISNPCKNYALFFRCKHWSTHRFSGNLMQASHRPSVNHLWNPAHLSPPHTSMPSMPLIMLLSPDRIPIPRKEVLPC